MVVLAQLSDLHRGPLPAFHFADLLSKRLFGRLNWRRSRGGDFDGALLDRLVADLASAQPEQILVTGDLTNLGSAEEFVAARDWLMTLGRPENVTVIPGNHDAYVPGAFAEFRDIWRPFMIGDGSADRPVAFPFVRRRGSLAILGVSSAVPTAPLMATGRIDPAQADALAQALAELGRDGLFRVVLIHHPPTPHASHWHRRLIGAELFRRAIREAGAELILHGHNHRLSVAAIPGPDRPVPVVGARAGGLAPRHDRPGGSYNLIRIEGAPGRRRVTLAERGVRLLDGPVETMAEMTLLDEGDQPATVTQA